MDQPIRNEFTMAIRALEMTWVVFGKGQFSRVLMPIAHLRPRADRRCRSRRGQGGRRGLTVHGTGMLSWRPRKVWAGPTVGQGLIAGFHGFVGAYDLDKLNGEHCRGLNPGRCSSRRRR